MRFTHTHYTDSAVKFLMFCTHIFECQIWEAAASLKLSADAGKHWWLMNAWCLSYQGPRTVSSAVGNNSDMPQNRYIYNHINIYILYTFYIYIKHILWISHTNGEGTQHRIWRLEAEETWQWLLPVISLILDSWRTSLFPHWPNIVGKAQI